jgi:hypothetical protein
MLLTSLDRARRAASNGISFGNGTSSGANINGENSIILLCSIVKNYISFSFSILSFFSQNLNLPFDRTRRALSGTH